MVSNIGALRSASFTMLFSASSGARTYLPVNANQYVYSQFKYVAGIPVQDGSGVSLTKLKILNTIIDQLLTTQKSAGAKILPSKEMSDEEISSMAEEYQKELIKELERASEAFYKPPMPETGLVFNIQA